MAARSPCATPLPAHSVAAEPCRRGAISGASRPTRSRHAATSRTSVPPSKGRGVVSTGGPCLGATFPVLLGRAGGLGRAQSPLPQSPHVVHAGSCKRRCLSRWPNYGPLGILAGTLLCSVQHACACHGSSSRCAGMACLLQLVAEKATLLRIIHGVGTHIVSPPLLEAQLLFKLSFPSLAPFRHPTSSTGAATASPPPTAFHCFRVSGLWCGALSAMLVRTAVRARWAGGDGARRQRPAALHDDAAQPRRRLPVRAVRGALGRRPGTGHTLGCGAQVRAPLLARLPFSRKRCCLSAWASRSSRRCSSAAAGTRITISINPNTSRDGVLGTENR